MDTRATAVRVALAALAIAGAAVGLLLQQQRLERLRAENAALREQAGELALLRAEKRQRADQLPAAAETARLQEQQAELLRLRGEVTRLRNEARQNAARGATGIAPTVAATTASGQPETDPVPFTAAVTVSVGSGQTFATGGWPTARGTRTFLLATPTLSDSGAGGRLINIAMCLLKVAEGDLSESLLRQLQAQAQAESLVLTGTEAEFLRSKVTADGATNIVFRPQIVTSDGEPASWFVGESRPNPDGTQRQIGTKIDLSPQVAQDGQTIQVGVSLEYVPRAENDGADVPAKAD